MTSPRASGPGRAVTLALGVLFLAAAGFWAYTALKRPWDAASQVRVRVRVLDEAGVPLGRTQVRSRYGGQWVECDARGEATLTDPRTKAGLGDLAEALADALQGRGAFHAARRGTRATVVAESGGAFAAELRLAHCGILRLGVAPAGLPGARARVDPDPSGRRWQLAEGHDVIRAGEAASYVVFESGLDLWVTLEGDRGVAQTRLRLEAPGPGMQTERSLSPGPAQPIRGRVTLPEGAWVPTLAGRLEVTEHDPTRGEHIPRLPVRVEADGSFLVDYVGQGRFELTARLPFASVALPAGAEGGDEQVLIQAQPRPWIEVGPPSLASVEPAPRISLFEASGPADLLATQRDPVVRVPQGLAVPCPRAGDYRVLLYQRGSDAAPPRRGEVQARVGIQGPTAVSLDLEDVPYATLLVTVRAMPERGGVVRVLPDRERTLLPKVGAEARFAHLPVGQAFVWAVWRDESLAQECLYVATPAGTTTEVALEAAPGVPLRLDTSDTVAEYDVHPWTLRLLSGRTPYGEVDARLPLDREGGGPLFKVRGALKPGAYVAVLEPAGSGDGPRLEVSFTLAPGDTSPVRVQQP